MYRRTSILQEHSPMRKGSCFCLQGAWRTCVSSISMENLCVQVVQAFIFKVDFFHVKEPKPIWSDISYKKYIYIYIGFWKQARHLAHTRGLQNSDCVAEDEPIARPLRACQMNLNWWFDQKAPSLFPADTCLSADDVFCRFPFLVSLRQKEQYYNVNHGVFLHEHVLQSAVLSRRKSSESWMP